MSPEISVLMPVYNASAFVGQAIESILEQSYYDFEFLIIDDGSSDGSSDIIKEYAKKDSRIVNVHKKNSGLISTLNYGLRIARGKFIARMDADDISLRERLELQASYLRNNPKIGVLGSDIEIMDETGNTIRPATYPLRGIEISEFIANGSPLAHPAVMFSKCAVLDVGGYRPSFVHAEDYDLWLRMFEKGFEIENYPQVLLRYRQHENNISHRFRRKQSLVTLAAQLCHECRKQGLPDPIEGEEEISVSSFSLFPAKIKETRLLEWVEVAYGPLVLATDTDIREARKFIENFFDPSINTADSVAFHLKCAQGLWRRKNLLNSFHNVVLALLKSPREFSQVVYQTLASR